MLLSDNNFKGLHFFGETVIYSPNFYEDFISVIFS